jgi:hypothetical protein
VDLQAQVMQIEAEAWVALDAVLAVDMETEQEDDFVICFAKLAIPLSRRICETQGRFV